MLKPDCYQENTSTYADKLTHTFNIGTAKSSGSNMSDLEQILNEPLTFLK